MSSKILSNDASASSKGTIYQLYIALQKCFEMTSGQKVSIEKYGDVSVVGSAQIEVKHVEATLTDGHINFWKTLHNWMREEFNDQSFSALVLFTTQHIGNNSQLKNWNGSNATRKLAIIHRIFDIIKKRDARKKSTTTSGQQKPPESLRLMQYIFDPSRSDKLRRVVDRFVIADSSPDLSTLFATLKDVQCKHILQAKCDDYLHSLMGYVIAPTTIVQNSWEISYEDFKSKVQTLSAQYCTGTRQFPVKFYQSQEKAEEAKAIHKKPKLFVEKIQEIEYHDVISEAIADYLYASNTVLKELKDYEIPTVRYEMFSNEVLKQLGPIYRTAVRNIQDSIKDSKNYYDAAMTQAVPGFSGFETPSHSFRNGVIHMHCDDPKANLKWKLEPPL